MDILAWKQFFFWCMIVNLGLYLFTVGACLGMRDFMASIHAKWFGLDAETTKKAIYTYIAIYKLAIIVLNFTPWLALVIMT